MSDSLVSNNRSRGVIKTWNPPGVRPADGTEDEMKILFERLPPVLAQHLQQHFADQLKDLCEIYFQLGQIPECIFADPDTGRTYREDISTEPCGQEHVDMFSELFAADADSVTTTKRRGIARTLHRISLVTHPMRRPEKVLGVAVRVGRAMEGLLDTMAWENFLVDHALARRSLVLVGRPGVGKTTCLREIARGLADDRRLNVVVVDKTCEIAGDGDVPHRAVGRARWMPVGVAGRQHDVLREAVENQTPDVIVVDEISSLHEVAAARTASQRGVALVATVHGLTLPELLACKERSGLVGGVASVTLSGREADRRRDKRKQVQKRNGEPVFAAALELRSRTEWIYHPSVKDAVDAYLDGQTVAARRLTPGRAVPVTAVPVEGTFEYFDDGVRRDNARNGFGDKSDLAHDETESGSDNGKFLGASSLPSKASQKGDFSFSSSTKSRNSRRRGGRGRSRGSKGGRGDHV